MPSDPETSWHKAEEIARLAEQRERDKKLREKMIEELYKRAAEDIKLADSVPPVQHYTDAEIHQIRIEAEKSYFYCTKCNYTGDMGPQHPNCGYHASRLKIREKLLADDVLTARDRIAALEDAITEAGILLSAGNQSAAMNRLGSVMNRPDVLKRQGI